MPEEDHRNYDVVAVVPKIPIKPGDTFWYRSYLVVDRADQAAAKAKDLVAHSDYGTLAFDPQDTPMTAVAGDDGQTRFKLFSKPVRGTLRRDIAALAEIRFDYAVLDEAQAIKNTQTATAKAARLIRADHRLALSGTPIENYLGELWSLFEFINPGLLGRGRLAGLLKTGGASLAEESRSVLARALRPYILRRTKAQVAADLPEKPSRRSTASWPPSSGGSTTSCATTTATGC